MDQAIYAAYYHLERKHWWWNARMEMVLRLLKKYHPHLENSRIADIGTGTGSYLEALEKMGLRAEGHDASGEAAMYLKEMKHFVIHQKKFPEDYSNEANEYDVLLLLDVLEHIQNDGAAVTLAARMLKPGGTLICTVPACKAMWGPYDIISHHFRRYNLNELKNLFLAPPDLKIQKISYFSTFLFPLLFSVRVVESLWHKIKGGEPFYNPHMPSAGLNSFLFSIFRTELKLLEKTSYPFGSSLIVVAKKQ